MHVDKQPFFAHVPALNFPAKFHHISCHNSIYDLFVEHQANARQRRTSANTSEYQQKAGHHHRPYLLIRRMHSPTHHRTHINMPCHQNDIEMKIERRAIITAVSLRRGNGVRRTRQQHPFHQIVADRRAAVAFIKY